MANILALVLALAWSAVAADPESKPRKVSGLIRYHQKVKTRPAGLSVEQHKKQVKEHGLNPEKLDREDVAFYVTQPLTPDEVKSYAQRGIRISTNNWVPPVAGKHAHGYYLAEVPYSRLDELEADGRVVRLTSTEVAAQPQDDVARAVTGVNAVHLGTGLNTPRTGTGVRVAIADSALDAGHPDFTNNPPFEAYDVTVGNGTNEWSTNVELHKTSHGTSVSSALLGSGTNSGGLYRGVAPSVQWAFYKIGDVNGFGTFTDQIKALNRAVAINCRVFSLSYGGHFSFLDGSDAMEQAIDAAVSSNVTVVVAAGNSAEAGIHQSTSIAPATTSPPFTLTANNISSSAPIFDLQVLWRDSSGEGTNIVLTCTNLQPGESLTFLFTDVSPRQTSRRLYRITSTVPAGQSRTYHLQLQNTAASGPAALAHCYTFAPATLTAKFDIPDSSYTVTSPAVADGAIAVGALVHRPSWTICNGSMASSGEVLGQVASFSGRGPRVDGLQKPDVVAPGAFIISAQTRLEAAPANQDVANIGIPGCSYSANAGTSVAAPLVSGMVALLLQAQPSLKPADVRTLFTTTTTNTPIRNANFGWGLVNASNAVNFAEDNQPGVWVQYSYAGVEQGNFARPFNTVIEGVTNAPSVPPAIIPRVRIRAGNRTEAVRITNGVRIEAYDGPVRFGTP